MLLRPPGLFKLFGMLPVLPVLVVFLAFLRVTQHLVRLVDLLKLSLGFLVVGINVRMILPGQPAVSLLDFGITGILVYT